MARANALSTTADPATATRCLVRLANFEQMTRPPTGRRRWPASSSHLGVTDRHIGQANHPSDSSRLQDLTLVPLPSGRVKVRLTATTRSPALARALAAPVSRDQVVSSSGRETPIRRPTFRDIVGSPLDTGRFQQHDQMVGRAGDGACEAGGRSRPFGVPPFGAALRRADGAPGGRRRGE